MEKTLSDFSKIMKEKHSGKIAYKYMENKKLIEKSYDEMACNIDAVKSYLLGKYQERSKIAIISESSYHWITLCMGIYSSNNIVVSVDYNISSLEIFDILQFVNTKAVFISRSQFEKFQKSLENLSVDVYIIEEYIKEMYGCSKNINCSIDNESLGHLLFTSGTTSKRKGIMLSYKNVASEIYTDGITCDDSMILSVLPMYHCYELFCSNLYRLYRGSTICINDNICNLMENMQLFKPGFMAVVPEFVNKFSNLIDELGIHAFHQMTGGHLKTIVLGGASIDKNVLVKLAENGIMTYQGYGMTETTGGCLINKAELNVFGSVGTPMCDSVKAKVVNGELLIKGPTVMMGYYQNEEATNAAIKDGWLHTGDLAEIDANGIVTILGRKLNKIVLSNGKNIYPEELEEKLNNIPRVVKALIYEKNNKLQGLIQINDEKDKADILRKIEEINTQAVSYKKIVKVDFTTKQFPMTTTMKVKRKILLDNLDNYLEQSMSKKDLMAKIKGLITMDDTFSYDDNLFENGFDSMSAIELSCLLDINTQDVYRNPTVTKLHSFLNNKADDTLEKEDINKYIKINKDLDKPFKENVILLTGATGFLGAHLLNEIADRYQKIYCLIRDEKKFRTVYKTYFESALPSNVRLIFGDIEHPMLGMDEETYYSYVREINGIIHCAANVNHVGDYAKMARTNVDGTKNIITFARRSNSILHYISTYSVSGCGLCNNDKPMVFDEDILDIGQEYESNIYTRTKYEAECEILKARLEGLLVNIYRIGSLSWRHDGTFQINKDSSGLLKRLYGMLKSNTVTDSYKEKFFDLTAVDECAAAIGRLMEDRKTNNIYHMFNPMFLSIKDFVNDETRIISVEDMKSRIKEEKDNDIKVYYYYHTLANDNPVILSAEKTIKKLECLNFQWKKINREYIFKYIQEASIIPHVLNQNEI